MSLPITIRLDLRATAKLVVFATNLGFIREFEFACPHYAKKAKKPESCNDAHDRHVAVFLGGHAALAASSVIVDDKDVADAIARNAIGPRRLRRRARTPHGRWL